MKIRFWKNTITLFFLSAFLFLRIANVHAISHSLSDDELQNCELCDLITTSNEAIALYAGSASISVPACDLSVYEHKNGFLHYHAPEIKTLHTEYFHNKPPPSTPF